MKYIIASLILFFLSMNQVLADCAYQKIEPVCSISGETYTNTCEGWSDTSSWSMPVAHEGECIYLEELSDTEKSRIREIVLAYFYKKGYVEVTSWENEETSLYINTQGEEFIQDTYFPAIQNFIQTERRKGVPVNRKHVSIMNYAAKIIGYDYYISSVSK